jgi:hypothetical protein
VVIVVLELCSSEVRRRGIAPVNRLADIDIAGIDHLYERCDANIAGSESPSRSA